MIQLSTCFHLFIDQESNEYFSRHYSQCPTLITTRDICWKVYVPAAMHM